MKNAIIIGGTGTISSAVTKAAAMMPGWRIFVLNRGNRSDVLPDNVTQLHCDVNDEAAVQKVTEGLSFDCACDFIGYRREHAERDWRIFRGRTSQFIFISSASAYLKPCPSVTITEETPLGNPFWQYSRDKMDCENFLTGKYLGEHFPVTVVRPSHTYDERKVPVAVHGEKGSWQVLQRMLDGKPVIVHGGGDSLWTLTHNSDFARGFTGLMGNADAVGEAFHITSDESLTWNEIYSATADALGVPYRPVYISSEKLAVLGKRYDLRGALFGDKANSVKFDNSKLKKFVPGYEARIPFREGVRKTVENILARPELRIPDPEFDAWCDETIAAAPSL